MSQPNSWRRSRIAEVTEKVATWNPRNDPRENIRYVDVSGISREELRIVAEANYSAAQAPSRARKIVKTGDTIVATVRPTLRRIAQVPASFDGEIVSTAFCVLRPDRDQIAPDFLFFATQLDAVMSGIAALETGASYPAVRDSDVLEQLIPVPPLAEQREIAAVLNMTRSSLLGEGECESATVGLKRAAMSAMFTRGLRGEAQKETVIGPMPESWASVTLESACSLSTGTTPSTTHPEYYNGTVPFIKTAEIVNNRLRSATTHVTHQAIADYSLRVYKPGTVLMAMYGQGKTRGQVALLEIPATTTQNAAAIEPNDSIESAFLWQYLLSNYDRLRGIGSLGHLSHLNLGYMRELYVVRPSIEEQREIVKILDAIDRKINLHRRKRAVLNDLFKALLHKLMTGEIRVGDLDLTSLTPEQTAEVAA